jgi:hypothetical protein
VARELVFTVDETLVGELTQSAEAYRRKDLFGFRPFNAESLSIERNGETWSFEKTESTAGETETTVWRRSSPDAAEVDPDPVFAVNGDEPGAARLNTRAWDDAMEALDALDALPAPDAAGTPR